MRIWLTLLAAGAGSFMLYRQARSKSPPCNTRRTSGQAPERNSLAAELPAWLRGGAVLIAFSALLRYESKYPLRRWTESKLRRDGRNFAMALLAGMAVQITEKPVTDMLTEQVHRKRRGLLKSMALPGWLELPCAVILLDYTLYIWHVLTHKLPLLWRFHRVHHLDLDLDATTALRFHFGEMLLSVPWRAMQIVLIGVSRLPLSVWQTLTVLAILFHHSNARLPMALERPLSRLLMTPRMHGIHHSIIEEERNSNWSTIFSFSDTLHGTRRFDVPQQAITIGIPDERDPYRLTLGRLVVKPWVEGSGNNNKGIFPRSSG